MSVPRWQEPNLARAPFVNERPVRRLAIVLWLLFAVAAIAAVWMSRSMRQETETRVAELSRLSTEAESARVRAANLEAELRRSNLPAQNERTEFLNRRLAERSFSWGRLLEVLTQTMPRGVRLMGLAPEGFARERRRTGAKTGSRAGTPVALRITGEAEETEALLEFVDRLFQHPAFDSPNLSRESEKKDFRIQFDLTVGYLPQVADQQETVIAPSAIGASPAARRPGELAAAQSGGIVASTRPLPTSGRKSDAEGSAVGIPWGASVEDAPTAPPAVDRGIDRTFAPTGGRGSSGAPAASSGGINTGAAGSGSRPGAAPAPAAPSVGNESRFPANVMPAPLRPYASSIGGGR